MSIEKRLEKLEQLAQPAEPKQRVLIHIYHLPPEVEELNDLEQEEWVQQHPECHETVEVWATPAELARCGRER